MSNDREYFRAEEDRQDREAEEAAQERKREHAPADRLAVDRRGTIPEFVVERGWTIVRTDPSLRVRVTVAVNCASCKQTFWVEEPMWRESLPNPTRSCPYCFRAGRVPDA